MNHGQPIRTKRTSLIQYTALNYLPRLIRGANASSLSEKNPANKRRDLMLLAALIEYPGFGLILFETGCAEDLEIVSLAVVSSSPFSSWKNQLTVMTKELGRPTYGYLPAHFLHRGSEAPSRHSKDRQSYQGCESCYYGPPSSRPRRRS